MEWRATPLASSATVVGVAPTLQAFAIMPFVSSIVGMFVVVGVAAAATGAVTEVIISRRVRIVSPAFKAMTAEEEPYR
jgi:hypothetical protein